MRSFATILALGTVLFSTATSAEPSNWYPDEKVTEKGTAGSRYSVREGKTSEGYSYSLSPKGSELRTPLQEWWANCKIDSMTDAVECSLMMSGDVRLLVFYDENFAPSGACLYSQKLDSISGMIRVDKLKARKTDWNGCLGREAAAEIISGASVLVRTDKFAPDLTNEYQLPLDGYARAFELIKFLSSDLQKN